MSLEEENKELKLRLLLLSQLLKEKLVYYSDGTYGIPYILDYEELKEIFNILNGTEKGKVKTKTL